MAKSPEEGMATLLKNLEASTGRSIDAWVSIARATGLAKHGQLMTLLKGEHGLTHGFANQIALRAVAKDDAPASGSVELIEAQFAGPKAPLRPIYEAIVAAIKKIGPDVEFAPKKAYVSIRRSKQFAMTQPTTATRLDVGLILKGVEPLGRLEASGSFNAMFTHRVRVASPAEVDDELVGWLRRAYDGA
jgi:hypothetical protein